MSDLLKKYCDLGELQAAGLLHNSDLEPLLALPVDRVDYGSLYERFWPVLARAYDRFAASGAERLGDFGTLRDFCREQAEWLEPFADFMAAHES